MLTGHFRSGKISDLACDATSLSNVIKCLKKDAPLFSILPATSDSVMSNVMFISQNVTSWLVGLPSDEHYCVLSNQQNMVSVAKTIFECTAASHN